MSPEVREVIQETSRATARQTIEIFHQEYFSEWVKTNVCLMLLDLSPKAAVNKVLLKNLREEGRYIKKSDWISKGKFIYYRRAAIMNIRKELYSKNPLDLSVYK